MVKEFSSADRANFVPPPCPECGSQVRFRWDDVTSLGDATSRYIAMPVACTNRSCELSEPSLGSSFGDGWF